MGQWKKALFDAALIISGAGLNILLISTSGNGQDPLPVAVDVLVAMLITGLVSLALASLVHGLLFSMMASMIITDFLFVLYFVYWFAFSQEMPEHPFEEYILLPTVFVVSTAPTVLCASIGFGRLASRYYRESDVKA